LGKGFHVRESQLWVLASGRLLHKLEREPGFASQRFLCGMTVSLFAAQLDRKYLVPRWDLGFRSCG
jgi:hypothetical protein